MSLKRFYQKMRKLQDWWRSVLNKLNRMKDRLCKRWIQLERKLLHHELSRQPSDPTSPGLSRKASTTNVSSPVKLSIEERVQLALLDEKVRRAFATLELRARRYMHLPKVHVWLEDMKEYWLKVKQWRETKHAAAAIVGTEEALKIAGVMPWPPTCPSYFPGSDQEILDMVKRARKNLEDVTLIPTKVNKDKLEQRKRGKEDNQEDGLFKNINDEELKTWGIDLDAMPGLGKGSFQPVKAKKEGKTPVN